VLFGQTLKLSDRQRRRKKFKIVTPGQNKGLLLMLDAHSDLFSASSVDSDYQGFIGLIHPKGAFPFTMLDGFKIRPGHLNLVSML
jgi:hypothetical protein